VVVNAPSDSRARVMRHLFRLEGSTWVADRILLQTGDYGLRYGPLGAACAIDGVTAVVLSSVAFVFDIGATLDHVDFDAFDDGSPVPCLHAAGGGSSRGRLPRRLGGDGVGFRPIRCPGRERKRGGGDPHHYTVGDAEGHLGAGIAVSQDSLEVEGGFLSGPLAGREAPLMVANLLGPGCGGQDDGAGHLRGRRGGTPGGYSRRVRPPASLLV
jgi:hypothetical protein